MRAITRIPARGLMICLKPAKSSIVEVSLNIPITDSRLNLGIWQGIYLCEFRNRGGGRNIVATIIGE